jgi:DNA polymerase
MGERYIFDLLAAAAGITLPLPPVASGVKTCETAARRHAALAAEAAGCTRCPLRGQATQVVFADGDPGADLMLVGEGPGAEEDRQGVPFVGAAGQLLNRILEAAEIKREEIYIANVVKCRPPGNRLPQKDEVASCLPLLMRQIEIVSPKILVCLGSLATQALIGQNSRVSSLRGTWHTMGEIRIMPTFHPAALLRDPAKKRPVWEDMKLVRDAYRQLRQGREAGGENSRG